MKRLFRFYERVKSKGFGTGFPTCKDRDGNLVTAIQSVLQIWREHFRSLLIPEGCISDEITPIIDDGVDYTPLSQNEISTAIALLKCDKTAGVDGQPAKLFKAGGDELVTCTHHLINTIWLREYDWNQSVLCPVLEKSDPSG